MRFYRLISQFRQKLAQSDKVTKAEIETLYNRLNACDFRRSPFSSYYKSYVANLNRLRPEVGNEVDRALLLAVIKETQWKPTKPFEVLLYHLKYKYKLTSIPFIAYQKRKRRKELDAPEIRAIIKSEQQPAKKWIKVPLDHADRTV